MNKLPETIETFTKKSEGYREYNFTWNIKMSEVEELFDPDPKVEEFHQVFYKQFAMDLNRNPETPDRLSVCMYYNNKILNTQLCKLDVKVVDAGEKIPITRTCIYVGDSGWKKPVFFDVATLEKTRPWQEKFLELSTEFSYELGSIIHYGTGAPTPAKMGTSFLKLLKDELFADVEFVVGPRRFKAHRNILAVRNEYFHVMFTSEFAEASSRQAVISDIRPEVFEVVLKFLYSNDNPYDIQEDAEDVLIAADRFGIKDLVRYCEWYLTEKITQENYIKRLQLADTYSCKQLMKSVVTFMKENYKLLAKSVEWKKVKNNFPSAVIDAQKSFIDEAILL